MPIGPLPAGTGNFRSDNYPICSISQGVSYEERISSNIFYFIVAQIVGIALLSNLGK